MVMVTSKRIKIQAFRKSDLSEIPSQNGGFLFKSQIYKTRRNAAKHRHSIVLIEPSTGYLTL